MLGDNLSKQQGFASQILTNLLCKASCFFLCHLLDNASQLLLSALSMPCVYSLPATKGSCNLPSNNWQFLHAILEKISSLAKGKYKIYILDKLTLRLSLPPARGLSQDKSHTLGRAQSFCPSLVGAAFCSHSSSWLGLRVCARSKQQIKNKGRRSGFISNFINWTSEIFWALCLAKTKVPTLKVVMVLLWP